MSPQDQAAKDKALQSMAAMSSAQIISAAAFHSKMTLTRGPGYPAVSGVSGAACSRRLDHPVLLPPPPSEETRRWPHQSPHLSLLREGGTKDRGPCRCWNRPLGALAGTQAEATPSDGRPGGSAELARFPGGASDKEPACQSRRHEIPGSDPWAGKIPWRRAWQPTPVLLPGESHGQRSLVGYSSQ